MEQAGFVMAVAAVTGSNAVLYIDKADLQFIVIDEIGSASLIVNL